MNQYSEYTRETGPDNSQQQRETFLPWQSWTMVLFNHRCNVSLFTRWRLPREVPQQVQKRNTEAVRQGQEDRDRGWGGTMAVKWERHSVYFRLMRQCLKTREATEGKTASSCDLMRFPEHIPLHCHYPGSRCLDSLPCTLPSHRLHPCLQGHNWLARQEHISAQ